MFTVNSEYNGKCLHILQTEQFTKLRHDPTKSIEKKMQRKLATKIKNARVSAVISHMLKPW